MSSNLQYFCGELYESVDLCKINWKNRFLRMNRIVHLYPGTLGGLYCMNGQIPPASIMLYVCS